MPLYEWRCPSCDSAMERVMSALTYALDFYDQRIECPGCGASMDRVITNVGMALKGEGWPGQAIKRRKDGNDG